MRGATRQAPSHPIVRRVAANPLEHDSATLSGVTESTLFFPAASVPEAAARMFALTGTPTSGTRGPKRALVALATRLGLDVDLAATNDVVAKQASEALDVPWDRPHHDGSRVTLEGLNHLLQAATERLWDLARQDSVTERSVDDVLRAMPGFRPARDKLEAVNRISRLTNSGPERLGPGGKEQKSVLVNLAAELAPHLDPRMTKHELAEAICRQLNVPWVRSGASTGQTITHAGLNLLLAGAERAMSVRSTSWPDPADEAHALLAALARGLDTRWDGREKVMEMRAADSPSWRHMEWQGFYFEEQVQWLLNAAYPPPIVEAPRRRYGNTVFDYATATRVWDAKAHTSAKRSLPDGPARRAPSTAILNDAGAVRACLADQGLGFLVANGLSEYDSTGTFDAWHRVFTREGRGTSTYRSNSGVSRPRKAAFVLEDVSAYWIENVAALDTGIAGGWCSERTVGRQPVTGTAEFGADRKEKVQLDLAKASPWQVARFAWR